jgi:antirestriction protein ArdC
MDRTFDNSAAYVNGWMEKLEKNPKWIVHASSKAEKAYRYVVTDNYNGKDKDTI